MIVESDGRPPISVFCSQPECVVVVVLMLVATGVAETRLCWARDEV